MTDASTGSATERPLRADARRNRARILEVAQEVFASQGLAAPIDEIAGRAGVGVGTIYRHFPTKEALFGAILVHRVEELTAEVWTLADGPDPGTAFFEFFARLIDSGLVNKDLFDALAASSDTDLQVFSAEQGGAMLDALGALLAKAQQAGAVRAGVSAEDVKDLMVGAHAMQRNHQGDRARTARMIRIICDGLRPPPVR